MTRLGESLDEPMSHYVWFARGFGSLELATGALAASFGVKVHLMDALEMFDGSALAVDGQSYVDVELDG